MRFSQFSKPGLNTTTTGNKLWVANHVNWFKAVLKILKIIEIKNY